MTRYTVSPPMLVEKSDKSEPIKGHYYYGQPGEIYFDEGAYNNDTEAYEQHLSSLQQIRMSDELVKWCEEHKKVEIDEGEFEVRCVHGYNYEGDDCPQLAYPVEVVDDQDAMWEKLIEDYKEDTKCSVFATHTFANWMKKHYKITRI